MTPGLLWLLVAYRNLEQVDSYVDHLKLLVGQERFVFAICDNSPVPGVSRHAHDDRVVFLARPDNPGYLEGALLGLDAWMDQGGEVPAWVAISNTDLEITSGDPLQHLSNYDPMPLVVAPRITEGPSMTEKNPHVLERRSLARLRTNAYIAWTPIMAMAYQSLSVVRWRVAKGRNASRYSGNQWLRAYPKGTHFYAPYGALIFFSRAFFASGGLPRHVPLLTEEYFIAEAAASMGAPVIFDPDIVAHHSANVTTGPKIALKRAHRTAYAFKAMYRHALRTRDNG